MQPIITLRQHLTRLLTWQDAHADFESAVADMPASLRGVTPPGLPYSPWQLLEHIRLAQADILAFCTRPDYREGKWPDDYWPPSAAPPTAEAWDASIAAYRRDLAQLRNMIDDQACDLFAKVPVGNGQTFLREFLLVADHTAYHVGQLVAVRRLLGAWVGRLTFG
jgi:DinB family protein